MKFLLDEEQTIVSGTYNYQFVANGGTATLQFSLNQGDFTNVCDPLSVDDSGIVEIGTGRIKAGLTGNATLVLTKRV